MCQEKKVKMAGHVLRMPNNSLARVAPGWTPQGQRKRGRHKITWRRSMEAEQNDVGLVWRQLVNRQRTGGNGDP